MVNSKTGWVVGFFLAGACIGAPALWGARVQIPAGTPLQLRIDRSVSSDASLNEPVDFTVVDAVRIGDLVVIPAGAHATGGVSISRMGGGKVKGHHSRLGITLNGVYGVDRRTLVPLRFRVGATYLVTSVSKKSSARIQSGTVLDAIVDRDTAVDVELPKPPEPVATLTAEPSSVEKGNSVTLAWTTENATDADLQPGIGRVDPRGSRSVSPSDPTTYTLTAKGAGGTKTTSVFVNVILPPAPPKVETVEKGTLDINSDPQGANIEIDGNLVGTTPSKVPLPAGAHKLTLSLRGYKTVEVTLTVLGGATQGWAPTLEKEAAPQ